jgi:hypothetical protein
VKEAWVGRKLKAADGDEVSAKFWKEFVKFL